jgi:hypothetical protein
MPFPSRFINAFLQCIGGEGCPGPASLVSSSYQTFCDPRLNCVQVRTSLSSALLLIGLLIIDVLFLDQSLEMAVFIGGELRSHRQQQRRLLSAPAVSSLSAAAKPVLASPVGS